MLAGCRIALAYEAGRDAFWLARWLIARGIEAHVIHSASVAVSREPYAGKPHVRIWAGACDETHVPTATTARVHRAAAHATTAQSEGLLGWTARRADGRAPPQQSLGYLQKSSGHQEIAPDGAEGMRFSVSSLR